MNEKPWNELKEDLDTVTGCMAIGNILIKERLLMEDEKRLQKQVEAALSRYKVPFDREHTLGPGSIPDFFIQNKIVLEVKLKGSAKEIYFQCKRYCEYDVVKALVLFTNKSMTLPEKIEGKPAFVLNLSQAWL